MKSSSPTSAGSTTISQPVLLGGLFIGILSALPIVNIANCCCLWVLGGGSLAAYLAQQDAPRPFTAAHGGRVGLLAGVAGAFVWVVAAIVVDALMAPLQERMVTEVLNNASDLPPELRAWLEAARDGASAPLRYAAGFLFQLLAGALFASAGGALTAIFFRRDGLPPAMGGDPIAPPPPLPPQ